MEITDPLKPHDKIVSGYLAEVNRNIALRKMVNSQGWHNGFKAFVFSNSVYMDNGAIYDAPVETGFDRIGSAAKWADLTSILDSPGMEAHALTLLLSFAAPLIPFTGLKGVTVMPYGQNTGKTTMIRWLASAWGNPDKLIIPFSTDSTSRIAAAGRLQNLPVCMDDGGDMSLADLAKISNEFSRGIGRPDGRDTTWKPSTWASILVVPGKESLAVKRVRYRNSPNSVPTHSPIYHYDLPDVGIGDHRGEIESVITNNYGRAGECYASWIATHANEIRIAVAEIEEDLSKSMPLRPEFRSLHGLVACVDVAADVAYRTGLIKFDTARTLVFARDTIRTSVERVTKKKI